MKKTFIIGLTVLGTIGASSCGEYCAECIELDSLYVADDFCGTNADVKSYIEELEDVSFQNWDCTKTKD
jgi:hypothetical protein